MISLFLAKILGAWMLVMGIALIKEKKFFEEMALEFFASKPVFYLGALVALFLGVLCISLHNIWVWDWSLLITVLGWMTFFKGALFLIFPAESSRFSGWYLKHVNLSLVGWGYTCMGAFLCFKGMGS